MNAKIRLTNAWEPDPDIPGFLEFLRCPPEPGDVLYAEVVGCKPLAGVALVTAVEINPEGQTIVSVDGAVIDVEDGQEMELMFFVPTAFDDAAAFVARNGNRVAVGREAAFDLLDTVAESVTSPDLRDSLRWGEAWVVADAEAITAWRASR